MKRSIFFFLLAIAPAFGADATQQLHDFLQREWDYQMERNPMEASQLGDRRWNDRWPDLGLESFEKENVHQKSALAELQKIERAKLTAADQLNYDLFESGLKRDIEGHPFRTYLLAVTQSRGIQFEDDLATSLRFETLKDYQDWLARLRGFPDYMDQTIALLREGIRARILQPKVTMQRVPGQIEKQLVAEPKKSGYYKPFEQFSAAIPQSQRDQLSKDAETAVRDQVLPAYRKFKDFFNTEYLPACFDSIGAWQWPNGAAAYTFLARRYTTTDLTPAQIHVIGLNEVRRIRAEMEKIKTQTGFTGPLGDFMQQLRANPKFYYKTGDELLTAYRALAKEIDPKLVNIFRTLPRTPYGVEPIPEIAAPDTTTAYYREPAGDGSRAGTYFVNLYRPETRPTYEMMALSLHESVPGHHLQIALAQEQGELPKFRRFGGYTAFIEGWGLYAEHLGDELGLYKDSNSKFGQLTYEMWRAVRLVVDTGMHSMKWDRDKAIQFFKDNSAKAENDIVNEIDRYISWPGQALAYKIGELKIKELRARAEKKLGDRFDVRTFHDQILLAGPLPLDILEKRFDAWLEKQ